jgi:hypothetical protein
MHFILNAWKMKIHSLCSPYYTKFIQFLLLHTIIASKENKMSSCSMYVA